MAVCKNIKNMIFLGCIQRLVMNTSKYTKYKELAKCVYKPLSCGFPRVVLGVLTLLFYLNRHLAVFSFSCFFD